MMNLNEENQNRKDDGGDEENQEKEVKSKLNQPGNHRRTRKTESARKSKNLSSNTGKNRRGSSRSRSHSRSRQPSNGSSKKSWKSGNAWLNFMQDFRESLRDYPALRKANIFRLAGEQWSDMSPEEKKPYIDAANKIKRMKQRESDNERRSKSKTRVKRMKSDVSPKGKNQKKNKRDEPKDEKSDSESDSGTEASVKTMESDNVSNDTEVSD